MAEGGALLRRYGDECLHRGFESLLLRTAGGGGASAASVAIRLSERSVVYGAVVQTLSSVWLTRIWPPGPSFHAYQLPFCETAQ